MVKLTLIVDIPPKFDRIKRWLRSMFEFFLKKRFQLVLTSMFGMPTIAQIAITDAMMRINFQRFRITSPRLRKKRFMLLPSEEARTILRGFLSMDRRLGRKQRHSVMDMKTPMSTNTPRSRMGLMRLMVSAANPAIVVSAARMMVLPIWATEPSTHLRRDRSVCMSL